MIQRYQILILSIFLSLWASALWAQVPQKTWVLTKNESSDTKKYVAQESITLKADGTISGFKFTADPANPGKTFSAKIDAGLLFPPNDKTYAVKASDGTISYNSTSGAVVGSIPGSASVTPTGAATYQIPIEVPSGVNGMQPNVSIVYNSQGGFGALGMGWDITGGSAITRGGKNIYFDGPTNNDPTIKFTNNDALYFDGQRLIYLSGGTGNLTPGATYATEVENYARVVYNGSGFVVTTKEGKTMEYGVTDNSRLINADCEDNVNGTTGEITYCNDTRVLSWKLNKVTDTYGNNMTYTYGMPFHYKFGILMPAYDKGEYLSKIEYGGQSVEFTYDHVIDVPKRSYISDFLVNQNELLSSIITKSGTTILKTFGFNYYSTSDNRLSSVDETAPDKTKLNSTTINWGAESNGVIQVDMGKNPDVNLGLNKGFVCTGDVDGDGYQDRIEMWSGSSTQQGHIKVYLFDKSNNKFKSTGDSIPLTYCNPDLYQPKMVASDINNDGKDEMILVNGGLLNTYYYKNGAIIKDLITIDTEVLYHVNRSFSILSANVNHDNYNDIVLVFNNYSGSGHLFPGYIVFRGSANGLIDKTIDTEYFVNDNTYTNFQVGDFNADGKIDILGLPISSSINENLNNGLLTMVSKGAWNQSDISPQQEFVADFNGDGLSDIITQGSNHTWRISENAGGFDFIPTKKFPNISVSELYSIDFNGDGQIDIITGKEIDKEVEYYDPNGDPNPQYKLVFDYVQWDFYKNNGGSFNNTSDYQSITYNPISSTKGFVDDINGDGVADLIIADGDNFTALTIPNSNRRNLVTNITNGMKQKYLFAYKNFSNYDQTISTAPLRNVKAPIMVVDTQTEPDGNVTTYTFDNPKMHIEGKGFLGFSTVTAVNPTKNVKNVSNYEIEPIHFGVNLSTQLITTADGTKTISTSKQYNGVIDALNKRYVPIVTSQTSFDQLKNIRQTTKIVYSTYPNNTQTTTTKDSTSGLIDLTTTVVTTFTGPGIIPYLPATVTTTRTQNSQSDSRTTNYAYVFDVSPNIYKITKSTITTDPLDANFAVSTEYIPDKWGHPQTVTVKAKDQNGKDLLRSSTVTYTPSGRFVASKTNVLKETTSYSWDETYGLLNSEKITVNGKDRITSYTYNGWGQLVETIYPTGVRKADVLQWATTNNAMYSSYSETSGSAPVTVWYDALGREIQKDTYGLNNNKKISVFTEYRPSDGKLNRVSEPTFDGDTKTWAATYGYDPDYGMVTSVSTPLGTTSTVYNKLTTTVTSPESKQSVTTNAAGQTMTSTINDKMVTYTYYPSGLTKTSTPDGGLLLQMEYNLQGKRTKLIDPDGGTVETVFDGFGELITEKQKVHNATDYVTTTNTYYENGLMNYIIRGVGTNTEKTIYTYDPDNRVSSIEITGKNKQTFVYDDYNRVKMVTEDITANGVTRTFISAKDYNFFGLVKKETYPSGYYTVNSYDNYSNLTEVKDNANRSIWKANIENALGQATSIFKGAKETRYEYDPINHLKTSIKATGIVDYTYGYDSKNNLSWRADNLINQYNPTSQSESFIYDPQNRLTNWNVTRNGVTKNNSISFDGNGNISQKSDLGAFTMNYGGKNPTGTTTGRPDLSLIGPHALSTISGVPVSPFPQNDLTVCYTDFKKIATLDEGLKHYELTYGVDDERRMSVYYANGKLQGAPTLTRYYLGDYEEEVYPDGRIRKIHYLSGAILIQTTGVADSLYYSYSDAQGSLIALVHDGGSVIQRFAYDPWGARRDPNNWNVKDSRTSFIINRGYTGHEHLDAFGIINMNGRVYDPLTAMFFSPDPALIGSNWLSYNRYGYCLGNPFRYTDPTGNNPFLLGLGAVIGGFVNLGIQMISGNIHNVGQFFGAFGVGALAGLTGSWIGGLTSTALGTATTLGSAIGNGALIGAGAGAAGGLIAGAGNAWMNGASFDNGLKAGFNGFITGGITGGILGGIGGGIDYLIQPPKITITQRMQQMMQSNPHGDGALAYKGEFFGVDKVGRPIVANLETVEVIGHHIPFHHIIHEVNPGLNGFPIEFAVLLAAFAPEVVAMETGIESETSSEVSIQFGKTENQIYHTFRHTDEMGLDRDMIKSAIESDFKTASSEVIEGQPYNKVLEISGQRIQYTGYKLPEGTFNIGRIHGIK